MAYAIKKSLLDDYYNWVISDLGVRKRKYVHYKKLLRCLFGINYFWTVDLDKNRYCDGMALRYHFCEDNELSERQWKDFYLSIYFPASVLEVLAAFSKKIAASPYGRDDDFNGFMFWVFMENLGLMEFDDDHFDEEKVCLLVKNWLENSDKTINILPIEENEIDKDENLEDCDLWKRMIIYMYDHPELSET